MYQRRASCFKLGLLLLLHQFLRFGHFSWLPVDASKAKECLEGPVVPCDHSDTHEPRLCSHQAREKVFLRGGQQQTQPCEERRCANLLAATISLHCSSIPRHPLLPRSSLAQSRFPPLAPLTPTPSLDPSRPFTLTHESNTRSKKDY